MNWRKFFKDWVSFIKMACLMILGIGIILILPILMCIHFDKDGNGIGLIILLAWLIITIGGIVALMKNIEYKNK